MPPGANSDAGAPPSVPRSFSNNFWGRDDAGVEPLITRMQGSKTTCDELRAFYKARAELEEEYSKKLFAICRKPLGSYESGTLRTSLDIARGECENMGKQHALIAQQMKSELEEPLAAFAGGIKERRKIVQSGIERLLKTKQTQTAAVNKSRDKYEQDCLRIKGYLAQGHMVMGQEERKNKAKLEKTQINMATNSQDYEAAVKVLEETTGRWNKEWKSACDKFQDLEEERLDFTKSSLWAFANIASTVCVSDDASCEKIRLALENCEVEKDIADFIKTSGTGQEIPDPPRYINFCRGDVDSASEVSEDDNYSVAQFSRTTNPAFRTSSPVHTNPEPEQPQRMSEEPVEEINASVPANAQQANSGRPAPLNYKQAEPNVPPNYSPSQHGEVAKVPHNEYPTEGMTMFCRAGPPSTTGSALSANTRPPSRDSQSEYSNPSSYTSAEPMSGKTSPTKAPPVNGVQMPGMTSGSSSPEKSLQKRRSGFFTNSPFNSPFRRKSRKELNHESTPQRSNWNVSTTRASANASSVPNSSQSSPTKTPARQNPFNRNAGNMAPEGEEPADPRATFQLNIGNNVLDVNNPDNNSHESTPRASMALTRRGAPAVSDEHDPIARALAELKQGSGAGIGIPKQASTRQPVDNYHRVKTPAPDQKPAIRPGFATNQDVFAGQRGTPPPAYDTRSQSALGVPQPAFTSKEMRSRTENWGMGSSVSAPVGRPPSSMGRPASRDGRRSPGPSGVVPRAISPQPQFNNRNGARSPGPPSRPPPADYSRGGARSPGPGAMARPNPIEYSRNGARSPGPAGRPQTSDYGRGGTRSPVPSSRPPPVDYNRNGARSPAPSTRPSPSAQPPPSSYQRSASPNPYAGRPRGSTQSGGQSRQTSGMEIQLAQPDNQLARYDGGSARSRQGMMMDGRGAARPASSYGGDQYAGRQQSSGYESGGSARSRQSVSMDPNARRERSKSVANVNYAPGQGQMVPAGRTAPLHYARAMYSYTAAIPEELSFSKGDILAVMRMQDDGWWEAEVSRSGKGGNVGVGGIGLVPSNYLQRC